MKYKYHYAEYMYILHVSRLLLEIVSDLLQKGLYYIINLCTAPKFRRIYVS